jgi:hypothetical protein
MLLFFQTQYLSLEKSLLFTKPLTAYSIAHPLSVQQLIAVEEWP